MSTLHTRLPSQARPATRTRKRIQRIDNHDIGITSNSLMILDGKLLGECRLNPMPYLASTKITITMIIRSRIPPPCILLTSFYFFNSSLRLQNFLRLTRTILNFYHLVTHSLVHNRCTVTMSQLQLIETRRYFFHDALLAAGMMFLTEERVLWFASIWLSIFLTIAIALHFRSLEQAIHEAKNTFERFVPPAYLRRIASKGLGAIRLGEADQQWVTILCCDIRGFTALSEQFTPSQLIAFVNRLYARITRVVDERQGVIDKFLGDAILGIFEGGNSAERAVTCGARMLTTVASFNREEGRSADHAVQIGIGLHTGPVILGTIGASDRMDSTVMGLTVNLAKRLEEATRLLGVDMLITDQVANGLPKGHGHQLRKLGEATLKGCLGPVGVVEVCDHDPPGVRHLKSQIEPFIGEGIELFKAGRFDAALSKFQSAQNIYPQDLPLQLLVASAKRALDRGEMVKGSVLLDFR